MIEAHSSRRARVIAAMTVAASLLFSPPAQADDVCSGSITRQTLVACALRGNLALRSEQQVTAVARARRTAANTFLPTNPELSFLGARRNTPAADATNWYVQLTQELQIAGQRGLRVKAAEAGVHAQELRVIARSRDVAAGAWVAYFDLIAAEEELRLAQRLESSGSRMAEVARARAEKGVSSPVDADVVEAAALRLRRDRGAAERALSEARGVLAIYLGVSTPIAAAGDLTPIDGVEGAARTASATAPEERVDVRALRAQATAFELEADAFRRQRVPNPRLSLYAQNDGFNERVFGVGISIPIPLPQPVGRTFSGEIAEADAESQRSTIEASRLALTVRVELETKLVAYASRRDEVGTFSADRLTRAEQALTAIAQELETGRLPVRDALVTQQSLIDLLRANVEARRALCIASVELARAAGLPLERGTP